MIQDVISFGPGTGLNWDDDLQIMPKGDGKNRLNVSLDESEAGGILSKSKGNALLNNIVVTTGILSSTSAVDYTYPSRKRYTLPSVADTQLASSSSHGGFIISITTSAGVHKIFHNAASFTDPDVAASNVVSKMINTGDIYIYDANYTSSDPDYYFYIEILDTCNLSDISVDLISAYIGDPSNDAYFENRDIVGVFYHEKDNELYTFWKALDSPASEMEDNLIMVYRYNDNVTLILNSEFLYPASSIVTWDKKNPITATMIGDDDSKILYWTDGVNPPMNINVEVAINTYLGLSNGYWNHDTDELKNIALNLIKYPPAYGCTVTTEVIDNDSINTKFLFSPPQFACRYIYMDNELSKWSVVSYLAPHNFESSIGIMSLANRGLTYRITLQPPETNVITKVEYAFRNTLVDRWRTFTTRDYDGMTAHDFYFSGTDLMEVIEDAQFNLLYDAVPLKSGVISSINDNRLLLADNTTGFDNTPITATLTPVTYDDGTRPLITWRDAATINTTTKDLTTNLNISSGLIYIVFKTTLKEYILYADRNSLTDTEVLTYFVNHINNNIVGVDPYITLAAASSNKLRITHTAGNWLYGKSTSLSGNPCAMKLKNGIKHYLGIVYYDLFGRMTYVNEINQDGTYIPFYTEQTAHTTNVYVDVLQLSITNQPPLGAYYWGIFYGYNSPKYLHTAIKVDDFSVNDNKLRIKVDEILNGVKTLFPSFNLSYQFTPGDRLRWIGSINSTTSGSDKIKTVTLLPNYIDTEIFGYDGDFNEYLTIENYSGYPASRAIIDAADYVLVEIYTPNPQNTPTFYYETPYKFPVLNPGTQSRYHGVTEKQSNQYGISVRDQTSTLSAICYFDQMDFRGLQFFGFNNGEPVGCYVDNESFSNYYESKIKNIGKPHIVNPDAREIRLNTIQWSNTFIPNSRVNGLSTFNFEDEKSMDDKFGRITGLEVTGDVLNVVQNSKLSSIYLGAVLSKDANGNEILSYSNIVIGEARASVEIYGSMHKYSIVKNGNYVYGFDIQTAVAWRKSNAGVEDTSGYKMKNYFKNKVKALRESGLDNILVVSGFDDFKKIYYLTFIDLYDSTNNETVGFHEPTNRWLSFYSFIPDMYGSIRNVQFLTFKDGFMYEQEAGTNCNYFGTQYGSEVWAVYNQAPTQSKTFESIHENANDIWDMPDLTSVIVDSDAIEYTDPRDYTHHTGSMQSRLHYNRFRYKHGEFHAGFLRDGTTQYNLFNGRKLRGKTLLCKLENDSTNDVVLRSITINANI